MHGFLYSKRKCFTALWVFLYTAAFLHAQVHISSQPHKAAVSAFAAEKNADYFVSFPLYTAGEDGFIIKWTDNETGEHFQISEHAIKMIALHPNGEDIAVYETDGFSLNRISVWNWPSQTRKFVKRLNASAACLSYSAKGNYLFIGMTNTDGLITMDPHNGKIIPAKLKSQNGIVSFAMTSESENTCIMYSPFGSLIYADLRSGKEKMNLTLPSDLNQNTLFYNNVLFAGVKNQAVYVFRADTGERTALIQESKPVLCTSSLDTDLYYLSMSGKEVFLKMLETRDGYVQSKPRTLKTLHFPQSEVPVLAAKKGNTVYAGTNSGNVYAFDIESLAKNDTAVPVSKRIYDTVYDIAGADGVFYFLTEKSVFQSSDANAAIYTVAQNNGYTNIETCNGGFILWSKHTKKTVQFVSDIGVKNLFSPNLPLHVLHVFEDTVIGVEGNMRVKMCNLQTGAVTQPYTGTGIQDVLLYTPDILIAAKSAAGNPKSALVQIDPVTKEIAALPSAADIAFSLSKDKTEDDVLYGAALTAAAVSVQNTPKDAASGTLGHTEIFAFYPQTKQYQPVFKWADEDNNAFTWIKNGILFSNVGKNRIHAYRIADKKNTLLERSSALPVKIAGTDTVFAVLNTDGGISWYDGKTLRLLKNRYITVYGDWLDFRTDN